MAPTPPNSQQVPEEFWTTLHVRFKHFIAMILSEGDADKVAKEVVETAKSNMGRDPGTISAHELELAVRDAAERLAVDLFVERLVVVAHQLDQQQKDLLWRWIRQAQALEQDAMDLATLWNMAEVPVCLQLLEHLTRDPKRDKGGNSDQEAT